MNTSSEMQSNSKSVMAPSTAASSVIVSLHPLVIMNISEHWTRVRAQLGKPTQGKALSLVSILLIIIINIEIIHQKKKFTEPYWAVKKDDTLSCARRSR